MTLRLSALALVVLASGCTWENRPDGASANHATIDGFNENEGALASDPMYGIGTDAEIIEPLDGVANPAAAPVDLTQPAPTTGTVDATSEVEEALTPGTEQ